VTNGTSKSNCGCIEIGTAKIDAGTAGNVVVCCAVFLSNYPERDGGVRDENEKRKLFNQKSRS
jgi:hypothetical protein